MARSDSSLIGVSEFAAQARQPLKVLVVTEDPADTAKISKCLADSHKYHFETRLCHSTAEANQVIPSEKPDLCIISLLPSADGGLTTINKIFSADYLPVVLASDHEIKNLEAFSARTGTLTLLSRRDINTVTLDKTVERALEETQYSVDVREKIGTFDTKKNSILRPWMASMLLQLEKVERSTTLLFEAQAKKTDTSTADERTIQDIKKGVELLKHELILRIDRFDDVAPGNLDKQELFHLPEVIAETLSEYSAEIAACQATFVSNEHEHCQMCQDQSLVEELLASLVLYELEVSPAGKDYAVVIEYDDEEVSIIIGKVGTYERMNDSGGMDGYDNPVRNFQELMNTPKGSRLDLAIRIATLLGGTIDIDGLADGERVIVATIPRVFRPFNMTVQ